MVSTGERFPNAKLHVRELLEASCECFTAVPAAVKHVLFEDLRMFVADVIGEESDVFCALKVSIIQRAEDDVCVEEKQVNFHVEFI